MRKGMVAGAGKMGRSDWFKRGQPRAVEVVKSARELRAKNKRKK